MSDEAVNKAGQPGVAWHPEVELKFRVTRAAVRKLLRQPPLAFALDKGERHLESQY